MRFVAATLAFALAAGGARAQSLGLRGGGGDVGGFPTSPTAADIQSPERVSPPQLDASPAAADQAVPPTTDQTQTTDQNAPDGSPNYGKPRKRKSNLYQFSKKTNLRALPPLVTYRRKIERRQQGEREEVTAAKSGLAVPDQTTPAPHGRGDPAAGPSAPAHRGDRPLRADRRADR